MKKFDFKSYRCNNKNYACKIWNMKGFYKMGRVVVVTFDENEEEKLNELLHFDLQTIY